MNETDEKLASCLSAQEPSQYADALESTLASLRSLFPEEQWGIKEVCNPFTEANKKNIWNNELRRPVREYLVANGKSEDDFADWLGGVHYSSIAIYSRSLFDVYQENRGWRILVLSFPRVESIVLGLASHYQHAMNTNRLTIVSNLLYEHLDGFCVESGLTIPGRPVASDDWSSDSLIDRPLPRVCGLELPTDIGEGRVHLKDVRTTTVKKILASMISIESLVAEPVSTDALWTGLQQLKLVSQAIS